MRKEHGRSGPFGPVVHGLCDALPHTRVVKDKPSSEDNHGHPVDLRQDVPQLRDVVRNHEDQALRDVLVLVRPQRSCV